MNAWVSLPIQFTGQAFQKESDLGAGDQTSSPALSLNQGSQIPHWHGGELAPPSAASFVSCSYPDPNSTLLAFALEEISSSGPKPRAPLRTAPRKLTSWRKGSHNQSLWGKLSAGPTHWPWQSRAGAAAVPFEGDT